MSGRRFLGPLLLAAFALFGLALALTSRRGSTAPLASPGGEASGRTPLEETAVSRALAPGLRPAGDDDAVDSEAREELRALYGEYRPYFVRGDFNGDGHLDFAQAFVRRDGPEPLFDVAVFFGSAGGAFSEPTWVDRGLLLAGGDLSADRSVLVVTDDVEQEISRLFRWMPAERRFVEVDEGDGAEDGEPWTEPDSRLGTTA